MRICGFYDMKGRAPRERKVYAAELTSYAMGFLRGSARKVKLGGFFWFSFYFP
jgi:hypothetical protein